MVIQISLLGLAFICFAIIKKPNKKDILLLLGGGFVISWLALLTMAYAPGNMNRDTIMAELSIALLRFSLESAFKDVPRFLYEWFSGNISLVVLLLSAGMSAGLLTTSSPSKAKHHLALGALLFLNVYILMWAGFVPQFAVMGIRPVEHAIFMPIFLWVFVLLGLFQGEELRAG